MVIPNQDHPRLPEKKEESKEESSTSIIGDDEVSISSQSTSIVSNTSSTSAAADASSRGDILSLLASITSFLTEHKAEASASVAAALVAAEMRHRNQLCRQPPLIFGNNTFKTVRNMNPAFLLGTHNAISSTAAFLDPGPSSMPEIQFDQTYVMPHDAATVHLHWYFPHKQSKEDYLESMRYNDAAKKVQIPTVLILHGINNHAAFGYMKRLAKALVEDASYIAVTVDFRGANAQKSNAIRLYTASFTNDLRSVVQTLSARCDTICLVGHSLGANIMTKYLGEEGEKSIIKAAVALANPSSIDSRHASPVYSPLLATGLKGTVWKNRSAWWDMMRLDHGFRRMIREVFTTWGLVGFDTAGSLVMVRNDRENATRVGYAEAESYWKESSSYQYVPNISTPLLQVYSRDDHLVAPANRRTLRYNLSNPNVVVVETPCGGHLGWQECNGKTYSADLTIEFFRAVLEPSRIPSKL